MKNKVKNKPDFSEHRKCLICGVQYGDQNLDTHMHSYVHKEAVELIKGSEQLHKCWACDVSLLGLVKFKEHIATNKHMHSLYNLYNKRQRIRCLKVNYNIDLTDEEVMAFQKKRQMKKQKCSKDCFVCRKHFPVQDLDIHMHSIFHHQVIEQLKGSPQAHKCWACNKTMTGMAEFEKHVGTNRHKFMLFKLHNFKADGEKVDYSADIDDELRALCDQRDQEIIRKRLQKEENKKSVNSLNASESVNLTKPVISEEFTNNQLPQSKEDQKLKRFILKQTHKLDMLKSSGPLVKKPKINLKEMSAQGTLTPEIEDGTSTGSTRGLGLVQSRMEGNKPNLSVAIGAGSTQKAVTKNKVVVPKRTLSKGEGKWKAKNAAKKNKRRMRKAMNGQEPYIDSLSSGTSLPEMFDSQTSGNDWQTVELVENIQPCTVRVKKKKSKECDTEQEETSLENSFETNSCNIRKLNKQVISLDPNPKTLDKTCRKRKVNKLLTLSSKEDELTSSLDNVGDELFQAYSSLQSAYTEVQRLLAVKQQVTSEMASLRAKRIKILHDMKYPTHSDQQVGINTS